MFEPASLGPAGDEGVIDMAFLSVIRRWALREEVPIREIARGRAPGRGVAAVDKWPAGATVRSLS